MNIETLAVHAGETPSNEGNEPLTPPIFVGTNYLRAADGDYKRGWSYTRADNPNRHAWEQTLAALEGGEAACAFSSGSAATTAVFQALQAGDHAIVTDGFYGSRNILENI